MKIVATKILMFLLWGLTLFTSVYLTAQRSVLSDAELYHFIGILVILGFLSVIVSYLYLKFLSPISTIQENMDDFVDEIVEE